MSTTTEFYPENFFIPILRRVRRASPAMVRRMLAGRAQYLEMKAKDFASRGRPTQIFIEELRAIAEVMAVYEEARPLTEEGSLSFRQRFETPPYAPETPPPPSAKEG